MKNEKMKTVFDPMTSMVMMIFPFEKKFFFLQIFIMTQYTVTYTYTHAHKINYWSPVVVCRFLLYDL